MDRLRRHLSSKDVDADDTHTGANHANAKSAPPAFLSVRSSKAFILSTICIAVFSDIFLYGLIVPVLPFSISEQAGIAQDHVQRWISVLLAVYGGALLVGSPLTGWYADRSSSRRMPLLLGLIALAGSTVMLCLARNIAVLVVGRILQGLSAAVVWTVGMALLVDTVGHKDIGQALGYVSLSMSLGVLVAPLLGGVVYERAGYYPVFYMAFGMIALDIILRLLLVEKKIARQWLDDPPASFAAAQAASANPGLVEAQNDTKSDEQHSASTPPLLTSSPPQSKYPAVITLLRSRRLLAALWGCVVQSSLITAFDSVIPLFVQEVFGWGPTASGLCFLALVIPNFGAPLVGWASDHYGPRWIAVAGFIFAIPCWVLLRLVTHDSVAQKVLFIALLALIGLSLTLALTPLMAEITYIVEAKEREQPGRYGDKGAYAQAYGLFISAFAAGTLIGPIWGGYVRDSAGWGTMTWSLGFFSLAGAVPCIIWTGGLITKANAKSAEERELGRAIVDTAVN